MIQNRVLPSSCFLNGPSGFWEVSQNPLNLAGQDSRYWKLNFQSPASIPSPIFGLFRSRWSGIRIRPSISCWNRTSVNFSTRTNSWKIEANCITLGQILILIRTGLCNVIGLQSLLGLHVLQVCWHLNQPTATPFCCCYKFLRIFSQFQFIFNPSVYFWSSEDFVPVNTLPFPRPAYFSRLSQIKKSSEWVQSEIYAIPSIINFVQPPVGCFLSFVFFSFPVCIPLFFCGFILGSFFGARARKKRKVQ